MKEFWIICFGSKWASPSVYTEKHFINRFYNNKASVLWVNPIPVRKISIRNITQDKSIMKKIVNRLKTQLKFISKYKSNFFILNPLFLPNVENRNIKKVNLYLLKLQIQTLLGILKIRDFGVISSGISNIPKIFSPKEYRFFIQISGDFYSDLRGISDSLKVQLKNDEINIFNNADRILAASKKIYNKIYPLLKDKNKLVYFPHGVEFIHFDKKSTNKLQNIRRPIAGYFGSLTNANDQRMFIALAEAGFSVVLIGQITGDYTNCKHKNIHFLGPIPYQDLPDYASGFDICIMAWKPAVWINNCNPSKTLEYLAMGKPIVSNTIPEIKERFGEFIYFADEPMEFVKKAKFALSNNNEYLISLRKKIAFKEDWDQKIERILSDIKI